MSDTATETQPESVKMVDYTVMADAVMLTVGRKANGSPEVVRITHGNIIKADPNDERIRDLLAIKCITRSTSEAARRGAHVTVKMVSKGMQGEEALVPNAAPLTANMPETVSAVPVQS